MAKTRSDIDAEEIRKLLRSLQGEGSPRTKECREYRRSVMDRLSCIADGFGYPDEVMTPPELDDQIRRSTCEVCGGPVFWQYVWTHQELLRPDHPALVGQDVDAFLDRYRAVVDAAREYVESELDEPANETAYGQMCDAVEALK